MRNDWRGPSSSSTINNVRLWRGSVSGASGLEGVSNGDREGMANELIASIGGLAGDLLDRAVADRAGRAIGKLISCVPTQLIVPLADADADDVSVGIRHDGIETGVGDGVLAVNVAGADAQPVEMTGEAKFVKETGPPV